ncbi:MAG: Gfo/Idh/MocA family oxidoreductase [Candidatus Omnitrophica bacterium]|jgi:predicted dehydrogenase|nr:Gfo/Idh/MocA family oxidoreductase [Candidatus Omnitrophota bacterium]
MRVGIIGLGKLGQIHLRIYQEIKEIDKIFLVDINTLALENYRQYSCFDDYHKLKDKVDLVSIATPTSTHFEIANFFLKRKIPVLVEKPLTDNLISAKKLVRLAKKSRTLLLVGHVERYNSAYLAIKKTIKNPFFIECHRLSPYPYRSLDISVVLDLMIHDLDIILYLLRDKITKIQAKGVKVLSKTADIANARLTFNKGCVANITSSRISEKKERKIRIFMPQSYISLDYAKQTVEIYKKQKTKIIKKYLTINKSEPLKKEIADFVNLVKRKQFTIEYAMQAKNALDLARKIEKIIEHDKHSLKLSRYK